MSQSDIEEIEVSIEAARKAVEVGGWVDKLYNNPSFKKIILDGYLKEEAARLAMLSNTPQLNEEQRNHVFRDLNGPGALFRYLREKQQQAEMAKAAIGEHQDVLDELRAEELDD